MTGRSGAPRRGRLASAIGDVSGSERCGGKKKRRRTSRSGPDSGVRRPPRDVRLEAVQAVGDLHDTIPLASDWRKRAQSSHRYERWAAVAPLFGPMRDPDLESERSSSELCEGAPATGAAPDPALEVFEHDPERAVRAAAAGPWSGLARSRLALSLLLRRLKEAHQPGERSSIGRPL